MIKVKTFINNLSGLRGKKIVNFFRNDVRRSMVFITLLMAYLSAKGYKKISSSRFFPQIVRNKISPKLAQAYNKTINKLDVKEENTIKRVSLIELALRNMQYKKSRTMITIGGMAVGIATIVFLVSIGYGVQELVVSRVASLQELKQADISTIPGGKLKLDDKSIANFKDIRDVDSILPLITVVGRVNFNNSVSDMAVYGVTRDYLMESALKPTHGSIFSSNDLARVVGPTQEVAGISTEAQSVGFNQVKGNINYSISSGTWIRIRQGPSVNSPVLGYTKRTVIASQGVEVYGDKYESDNNVGDAAVDVSGNHMGLWIKDNVLLWEDKKCDLNLGDCEEGKYQVLRDENNQQVQEQGYFAEIGITSQTPQDLTTRQVLGASTDNQSTSGDTADVLGDTIDISQISSQSAISTTKTKRVNLSKSAVKEAVVNLAMLKILGISENNAVGKTFNASFIATSDLVNNGTRIQSNPAEYKIVGVIPDNQAPLFYIPFIDLRSLGITTYSQAKMLVNDKNNLSQVRRHIAALGFTTSSVADTVSQINSLFSTIRTVLGLLGTVALVVAALGMFNTLTVSLLERTREVGLMKAMGMRSEEVKELFLTESMIMGFFGGIIGIILGFIAGKILGLILTTFAIFKGAGFIDVSYIPLSFVILIVTLSFIVGLLTGVYPARRATKISALNALRYE